MIDLNLTDSSLKRKYIYGDRQILAQHDIDDDAQPAQDDKYFYLHDRLGSVRLVIDDEGAVQSYYTYEPFGEVIDDDGTFDNAFLFTGQWFDDEIEEYYLRARQYNPQIARFTARDPVRGRLYKPMTLHSYLYCGSDPINRLDLTGRWSYGQVATGIVVGGGLIATIYHYRQDIIDLYNTQWLGIISERASTDDLRRFRDRIADAIPRIEAVMNNPNLTKENMVQLLAEQGVGVAGRLGEGFVFEEGTHDFTEGEQWLTDLYEDRGVNLKNPTIKAGLTLRRTAQGELQFEIFRSEGLIETINKEIVRRELEIE